jgi:hypothetical protein
MASLLNCVNPTGNTLNWTAGGEVTQNDVRYRVQSTTKRLPWTGIISTTCSITNEYTSAKPAVQIQGRSWNPSYLEEAFRDTFPEKFDDSTHVLLENLAGSDPNWEFRFSVNLTDMSNGEMKPKIEKIIADEIALPAGVGSWGGTCAQV